MQAVDTFINLAETAHGAALQTGGKGKPGKGQGPKGASDIIEVILRILQSI